MGLRIGIDVGGTFTDFCVNDSTTGERTFFKRRSTPDDPPRAIADGIAEILDRLVRRPAKIDFLGHGTTTATNMIIERKGAKTAFLTSNGFRDVLELGRQARPHLFDYRQQRPPPLVRRSLLAEVDERLDAQGNVLTPLDTGAVRLIAEAWRDMGIEAVAVGFLHAYRDPMHERAAGTILAEILPDAAISLSCEISPEPREFERFSTTVANAFIAPRMQAYAERLSALLTDLGIGIAPYTISSNGGLLDLETLRGQPVRTALSGPAAGVTGAARLMRLGGGDAVTFDVGGTSTDIALLRAGRPGYTADRAVAGLPIRTPMVEMEVIGAGGGSIARIDKAGALSVGPDSAGAYPGPVAYGLGGVVPTLTDAAATLGWLNPDGLLDGEVPLDVEAASTAIAARIAIPLSISPIAAAEGIVQVAVANMARAIRSLAVRKGADVSHATLLAYGGAGPLLAAAVAHELGIGRILVPAAPGTLCAQAMLVSDMALDLTTSLFLPADDAHWPRLAERLATLEAEGHRWLDREAVPAERRAFDLTLEARYRGQNFEIKVETDTVTPVAFAERFHAIHKAELGFALPDHPIDIVTARLKAIGRIAKTRSGVGTSTSEPPERRTVHLGGVSHRVAIWRRSALPAQTLCGPLVIEEMSTTTIIPPGWSVHADEQGDLILERTGS